MAIREFMTCGLEPIEQVLMPFQEFFRSKATGGILLIICATMALVWANSPWGTSYVALWETKFTVGFGAATLSKPIILWVNDGLMAMFFFVVGLEIKREFMVGELSSRSQAVLPIAAAIGGMIVPASIYAIINMGAESAGGWGIPMATDIAFALGILSLLGDRVPYQLKIFLTAVAIVDDLGGILVIALFYTSDISFWMLLAATLLLLTAFAGNKMGIRTPAFYAIVGCLVWLTVLKSGVHSTVAGVLMAFMIPARTKCDAEAFAHNASNILEDYKTSVRPGSSVLTNSTMHSALLSMQHVASRAQTPLQRLETWSPSPGGLYDYAHICAGQCGSGSRRGYGRASDQQSGHGHGPRPGFGQTHWHHAVGSGHHQTVRRLPAHRPYSPLRRRQPARRHWFHNVPVHSLIGFPRCTIVAHWSQNSRPRRIGHSRNRRIPRPAQCAFRARIA